MRRLGPFPSKCPILKRILSEALRPHHPVAPRHFLRRSTSDRIRFIVARFVFLEYLRKAELREVSLTDIIVSRQAESTLIAASLPDIATEAQERRLDCLDRCLSRLEEEQRALLLDYY